MATKKSITGKIQNRRARHDYAIGDEFMAGIVLTGGETKALRLGHGQLQGAYVTIVGDELFLLNALIKGDRGIHISEADQTRTRKLLASRKEINSIISSKQSGMAIIPLEILTKGRYIKVKIALARGKKKYDKRQTLKKRDEQRDIDTAIRR